MTEDRPAPSPRSVWSMPAFASTFIPLVAFMPHAERAALAPRIAVGLVTGAVGLPFLVRLAANRDRAAVAAAAFLGWGVVSAVVSGSLLSWSGAFVHGTGALFVLSLGGCWALGRVLPEGATKYLAAGFVAGAVVNAVVAMAQGPWDLSSLQLALYDDRSTGLFGYPLYLGAACAAGIALAPLLARARPWLAIVAMFTLACGAQMSGGRIAVALAVVAGLAGVLRIRGVVAVGLGVAIVLGLATGTVLPQNRRETAAQRLTNPGAGLDSRAKIWTSSIQAARDRPVLGYGPGRFLAATGHRVTLEQARIDRPDRLYFDAHNLFAQYAATMGFGGVALLGAWLVLAARAVKARLHPELLGAAIALFVFHLVEPQHVTLTPLMFMLLGAAAARAPSVERSPLERRLLWVPVVAAAGLAVVVLVGEVRLRSAVLDYDAAGARAAGRLLRPWAEPLHAETFIHVFLGETTPPSGSSRRQPGELRAARDSALAATQREPEDWRLHADRGGILRLTGDRVGAAAAYATALRHNPWSAVALTGRANELDALGRADDATACRELRRLLVATGPADNVPARQRACFG